MAAVENTRTWNQAHIFSYLPKKRLDRWKVCEDFQNGNCDKQENDCEYAHPSSEKEIIAGIVTVCMDDVNHQCLRQNCKYFHPPTHICDQIHDHKKRPYPSRSRSMSSVEREPTPFATSQDFYSSPFQVPYLYYQNTPQSAVYFPPYTNTSLNIPGCLIYVFLYYTLLSYPYS
eukprot:TRINITY_DN11561_c0_g2_i1.p1 TRINITY_DN11561_c0_g2~~TRINITY_DN11561_c0_g2_i1.p1  ORF type:complete len:173 (+),score=15.36 TRINITY_DN11561_c0_g2_i1:113-631(+)